MVVEIGVVRGIVFVDVTVITVDFVVAAVVDVDLRDLDLKFGQN